MKKVEARVFKERLLFIRARLRGDVNAMANAALNKTRTEACGDLSSMPIHMADVGSDNYEQEFTLNMMENEEDTLTQIEVDRENHVIHRIYRIGEFSIVDGLDRSNVIFIQ